MHNDMGEWTQFVKLNTILTTALYAQLPSTPIFSPGKPSLTDGKSGLSNSESGLNDGKPEQWSK